MVKKIIIDPEQFLCEKVCKKKKSCGIHTCGGTCCPSNKEDLAGNHLCLKVLSFLL